MTLSIPSPSASVAPRRKVGRRLTATLSAALCLLLLAACTTADQDQVLQELNGDRTANGIPALANRMELNSKAQNWAETMAAKCSIWHSDLRSGVPAGWTKVGENVGMGPSIGAIEDGFMGSPGHRENILDRAYNQVGVGAAWNWCNGYYTVFVAQEFARY